MWNSKKPFWHLVVSIIFSLFSALVADWSSKVLDPYKYPDTGFIDNVCLPSTYVAGTSPHICDRPCEKGDNRLCYFHINLVSWESHNPHACSENCMLDNSCRKCIKTDGIRSPLLLMSYRLPGPTIAVCTGDCIVVDVANNMKNLTLFHVDEKVVKINSKQDKKVLKLPKHREISPQSEKTVWKRIFDHKMDYEDSSSLAHLSNMFLPDYSDDGESTTLHFHGARQIKTPQSDGMPFITQAPIPPHGVFRHKFEMPNPGTFWYHSHEAFQRSLGIFAPLIVRSYKDPHRALWDYDLSEHYMIVTDFGHNMPDNADNLLLNSHGCFRRNDSICGSMTIYRMKPKRRYRFRFIFNGITTPTVSCWLDQHEFLITALDSNPIKPITVSSFVMGHGERIEGVFTTNQPKGNYKFWCASEKFKIVQSAILQYEGARKPPKCKKIKNLPTKPPEGIQYNTESAIPGTPGSITTTELNGLKPLDEKCRGENVFRYFIEMSLTKFGPQINNITNKLPDYSIFNQINDCGYPDESNFCNSESLQGVDCTNRQCECTHVVKLPQNECVELVAMKAHPFHLHGYIMSVIGSGKAIEGLPMTKETFEHMDRLGLVNRKFDCPAEKDVLDVPNKGYTIARFVTDNPGFWFAHCHVELHVVSGMSMIFWVGSDTDNIKARIKNHHYDACRNNEC